MQVNLVLLAFTLLHFADGVLFFFLNKLKVYGNSMASKSIGIIFPTAFAYLISLFHILIILAIFITLLLLLLYLLW